MNKEPYSAADKTKMLLRTWPNHKYIEFPQDPLGTLLEESLGETISCNEIQPPAYDCFVSCRGHQGTHDELYARSSGSDPPAALRLGSPPASM